MISRPDVHRALVFAPSEAVATWIKQELSGLALELEYAESVNEIVYATIATSPTRPQLLIADFDAMDPVDVLRIHSIREGWFGTVIALGTVAQELRVSLNIASVLTPPFASGPLRKAVTAIGLDRPTTKMTKLPR
jgi:hypothetical protein